ncbi:hypothetical protein BKA62DRAFT_61782 [Auriculariales sp. MPI-PUGE-AT-0066]|nr:hypothetical protein BKA62DRAFT_61782 [Auriculariales sp. MPI-PUGE-AT-0066]
MRSGFLASRRPAPPHPPTLHTQDLAWSSRSFSSEWRSRSFGPVVHGRADDTGCPSFSGLSFAVGLLTGLLIASVAFSGGVWYRRKAGGRRSRLRIDPYAANRDTLMTAVSAPHHIITEAVTIGSPGTMGHYPPSMHNASTVNLVTAASTPGFGPPGGTLHGRSTSVRSTATTATQATHATATRPPMSIRRYSRSDVSLPLPLAQRDARGKFTSLEDPSNAPGGSESIPVLPILRDGRTSMAPTRASMWSTGGITTDGFRPDRHISLAYTAQPSTATHEWFPRSPEGMDFPFKLPQATRSLESLARTAVARESVSSMLSTRSSRTRVAPPAPPPTTPLPELPGSRSRTLSAVDEKRMLALQHALHAPLPSSPLSPGLSSAGSPSSPLLPSEHRRSASGRSTSSRPLPEAPSVPNSATSMSARDEKAFLLQPWNAPPLPVVRPDSPSGKSIAESSRHVRRDTAPPAYSRPPSRFE